MGFGWSDARIAESLRSPDIRKRNRGVGAFVRRFTFSAPTDLALTAAEKMGKDKEYQPGKPLVEQLLEMADLSESVKTAWRVALSEGEALKVALAEFAKQHGKTLSRSLSRDAGAGEDACQEFLRRLLEDRAFRRKCLGSYAGEGELCSYLRRVLWQTAQSVGHEQAVTGVDVQMAKTEKTRPEVFVERKELQRQLKDALKELADDVGMMPFLLQHGMGMSAEDAAEVLGTSANTVRQRVFRFRGRLRHTWARQNPDEQDPFPSGDEEEDGPRNTSTSFIEAIV